MRVGVKVIVCTGQVGRSSGGGVWLGGILHLDFCHDGCDWKERGTETRAS